MSEARKTVFISSTAIDLPEHREKVTQACLERNCFPEGMERWPAVDADSLSLCLSKVDEADVFVGIYAHRYGWVPPGETKSITELEYDRAVARGIPRLLFLMGDKHPILAADMEVGSGAEALKLFKQRIQRDRVRATFDNSDQLRAELLHALGESVGNMAGGADALRIDLTHLPDGAEHFLGRTVELAQLDAAWVTAGGSAIVELIAPGGVGKTSLVKRWLDKLRADSWRGARRVYGWSFYSQGTRDDKQASEDHFLAEALAWFGVTIDPATNPWDKGRALAQAVSASRTLLVLDGVEPLQYPPGPLAGELHAPGLKALLQHLATAGHSGLCLITSRERLEDLNQYERNASRPEGVVQRLNLGNLDETDGARLLHALGTNRAGAAAIDATDAELKAASHEIRGHALTLSLLGRYLALAFEGDIRKRDQVDFQEADTETTGGHAFKVMAAYETWFASTGKRGETILAALRLFGFFDRPAGIKSLRALRTAPAISGLTRPLVNLDPKDWRAALQRLEQCGLIFSVKGGEAYDAHPLVREYLADRLRRKRPAAWREGHRRLYEQLKASVPLHPDNLPGLQPLYQAIAHGCLAGLYEEARGEVYRDRILRGTGSNGFHSTRKLGAFGADLGAVACFFDVLWSLPAHSFTRDAQGWLLNQAATRLRAVGRLKDALEPMQTAVEMAVKQEDWKNAAIAYSNLSELQLSLGQVAIAVANAGQAVAHADTSGNTARRIAMRTTLADALHQQGDLARAGTVFAEAERMLHEDQPKYRFLYAIGGFRYSELLLNTAQRAAWWSLDDPQACENALQCCLTVAERGRKMFEWREPGDSLLDIAIDHLTLAQSALYTALLRGQTPDTNDADRSVAGLRASGAQHYIPHGLLTRARLRHSLNDLAGAEADLDEAEQIASRGGMKLHLADIALTRARLFHDRTALTQARLLIEECGFGRRLPELEDAEKAAASWPDPPGQ